MDLVTLADYKVYKKLTKTDDDAVLELLISSVSEIVKVYCAHRFIDYYSASKEEHFHTVGDQEYLVLNEWPVKEIVSVYSRATYTDSYTLVSTAEYYLDPNTDSLFYLGGYWPNGVGSVKVTYKAGYSSAPEDVKLATYDLITHYFKEEFKERRSIGSASIDNSTRFNSTKFNQSKWPSHVIRILDMYRNVKG